MFDDLATHFYENVVAAYDSYRAVQKGGIAGRSRHVRLAITAAQALYHFREHLPPHAPKTRSEVVAACPDYRLVGDVANASKHGHLKKPSSEGPPLVSSAKDINEQTVITRYKDGDGPYNDARTVVVVKCTDGVTRQLDAALLHVLNYWGDELAKLKIVNFKSRPDVPEPGSRFVSRKEARGLDLEMVRGRRFKQNFRLLEFDAETQRSKPVDLSGSTLKMNIWKPAYELSIQLKRTVDGKEVDCALRLSDKESQKFLRLKTERGRDNFMKRFAALHQEEIDELIRTQIQLMETPTDAPV